MHIIWHGQSCFEILSLRAKGEQVKIVIKPLSNKGPDLLVNDFAIVGPGEYEIKDIFIQGISTPSLNTVYTIDAEEMRLCHLGDFDQKELTEEQLDQIGDVDILLVPVDAGKVISQIEPRIVIPMNYQRVDKFLKAMGVKSIEPQNKLLIKKKDLSEEETKVIVLYPPHQTAIRSRKHLKP